MLDKSKELIIHAGELLVEKIKELKDQKEIGKCIRTGIIGSTVFGITHVICKNGGINYNGKLLIGTTGKTN